MEAQIAWLAGLLEGEGCFSNDGNGDKSGRRYPRITVGMVDEDVIARVAIIFERRYQRSLPPSRAARGHQPLFVVRVNGDAALDWMRRVRPYMGSRRGEKIDSILAHHA